EYAEQHRHLAKGRHLAHRSMLEREQDQQVGERRADPDDGDLWQPLARAGPNRVEIAQCRPREKRRPEREAEAVVDDGIGVGRCAIAHPSTSVYAEIDAPVTQAQPMPRAAGGRAAALRQKRRRSPAPSRTIPNAMHAAPSQLASGVLSKSRSAAPPTVRSGAT